MSGSISDWEEEPLQSSGTAGGYVDTGTWNTPPMSFGQSLQKVGGALKDLTSGIGQGAGAAGAQDQSRPPSLSMAQAQAGRGGGGAQYLANLVQMLNARRDQYLTAATGGTQQPVSTTRGLLGI